MDTAPCALTRKRLRRSAAADAHGNEAVAGEFPPAGPRPSHKCGNNLRFRVVLKEFPAVQPMRNPSMQPAFRTIGSKDQIKHREDRTMKKAILAGLVTLMAGTAVVGPAAAASLTITTGDSARVYDRYDDGDRYDNGLHRGWYMRHHYGWRHGMTYRRAYRECEVTTTRHWHHGRMIVERTRVCD